MKTELKQIIISDSTKKIDFLYDTYDNYIYRKNSTRKKMRRLRNTDKIIKIYINKKFLWYILLNKLNRNIYLEWDIKELWTSY